MERLEVVNLRMWPLTGLSMATGKGMEVELERIESAHKSYPATIPFLKLLSTLIHASQQLSSQNQVTGTESLNTIPESLGQPYRLPGIGPFISFLVDNVFCQDTKSRVSSVFRSLEDERFLLVFHRKKFGKLQFGIPYNWFRGSFYEF